MLLTHLFFSENRSSKPKFTRSETGKPCSFILLGKTGVLKFQGCKTNIIIAFLVRFEFPLLETFAPYGISETSANLEYAHIKPNKWRNFRLYSNIDLPGIKRIPGKYKYKNS